ncbi:MAG: DUF2807 domain-containing protein [Devosia sp.]
MQRHLTAALAASVCLLPTFALAETKTLDVGNFHGVDVSSGIRAIVSGGKPLSVVADAKDAQNLTDLRYEVRDGVLHLWYDWSIGNLFDWSDRAITVTIGAQQLDTIEASAGASVEGTVLMGEEIDLEASSGASLTTDAIEGMSYTIEASSGAHIETSGSCTTAGIEVSSGASVAAKALDCAKVELEASSGASVEVTAKETISAEVSSGGHATVHGKPSVDHLETSTGGSVDFPS